MVKMLSEATFHIPPGRWSAFAWTPGCSGRLQPDLADTSCVGRKVQWIQTPTSKSKMSSWLWGHTLLLIPSSTCGKTWAPRTYLMHRTRDSCSKDSNTNFSRWLTYRTIYIIIPWHFFIKSPWRREPVETMMPSSDLLTCSSTLEMAGVVARTKMGAYRPWQQTVGPSTLRRVFVMWASEQANTFWNMIDMDFYVITHVVFHLKIGYSSFCMDLLCGYTMWAP